MAKPIRLAKDTEAKMLSPVLKARHPPLELMDYNDQVNYLVKFAIRAIESETQEIKAATESQSSASGPQPLNSEAAVGDYGMILIVDIPGVACAYLMKEDFLDNSF